MANLPRPPRFPVLSALQAGSNPEKFFINSQKLGGDPFCLKLPGMDEVFVTGHPEGAREIYSAPRETFRAFRANLIEPLVGTRSLLVLDGERHARERKLMVPAFHGERMRVYGELIQEATRAEIEKWKHSGQLSALGSSRAITLQIIIRAVIGVQDDTRRERFRSTMTAFLDGYTPSLLLLPFLRRGLAGFGPWPKFLKARNEFEKLLAEEIRSRREPASESALDVLSLLMSAKDEAGSGLSMEDLQDELKTLLVAGHETSATGLTWALYFAHAKPDIGERLRQEIAALGPSPTAEALAALPYLTAVCSEALRLHPVVPITIRSLAAPLQLRGHLIPAGKNVAVSLSLLHRHPDTWPDAETFRPERFIDRKYSPFEYAPFGGGHRRCVGASLATYEMKVILGTIFSHALLELKDATPRIPVARNITTGPKDDIEMFYRGAAR